MALKSRIPTWLSLLKDYWWLATVIGGALVLWGNLPERVKKVEAGQSSQQEELGVIRDATKEIQGYLKGQQALNERLAAQQQAPPILPLPEPRTPVGQSRDDTQELSDDGEVKEMTWTDQEGKAYHVCCNGTDCWPWRKPHGCAD